jgi:hypothetical protein
LIRYLRLNDSVAIKQNVEWAGLEWADLSRTWNELAFPLLPGILRAERNFYLSFLLVVYSGARTPVGLGQQGCKGMQKIKFRNMA